MHSRLCAMSASAPQFCRSFGLSRAAISRASKPSVACLSSFSAPNRKTHSLCHNQSSKLINQAKCTTPSLVCSSIVSEQSNREQDSPNALPLQNEDCFETQLCMNRNKRSVKGANKGARPCNSVMRTARNFATNKLGWKRCLKPGQGREPFHHAGIALCESQATTIAKPEYYIANAKA